LEALDPVRHGREIIGMVVMCGARCEEVASEGRRGVMALAGNDHRPVAPAHDDRLVAGGVPRCRYDEHVPQDLGLAVKDLIGQPRGIDKLGQRVVRSPRHFEFDSLREDRSSAQLGVPAAVVEMKVAVHHTLHVREGHVRGRQRLGEGAAARPVMSVDVRVRAHTGVDHDDGIRVSDDVAQAWLNSGLPGPCLLSGADEVAEVDTTHR